MRNRLWLTQWHCPALPVPWRPCRLSSAALGSLTDKAASSNATARRCLHPTATRDPRGCAGFPYTRSSEQLWWLLRDAAGFLRFYTTMSTTRCGNASPRAEPPSGRAFNFPLALWGPTGATFFVWVPGLRYVGCSWGFASFSLGFAIDKNLLVNKCLQKRSWANESFLRGK